VNNPWKDSSLVINDQLTTASAEDYQGRSEFGRAGRREWPTAAFCYSTGTVTHWPIWFEDPFGDKGNELELSDDIDPIDTHFAMNGIDYLHMAYGPARLLLNAVAWPISAIVTPPGTLLASDGRLSPSIIGRLDHDAERVDPDEVDPPDVVCGPITHPAEMPPEVAPESMPVDEPVPVEEPMPVQPTTPDMQP
jgi:hypothetical protein